MWHVALNSVFRRHMQTLAAVRRNFKRVVPRAMRLEPDDLLTTYLTVVPKHGPSPSQSVALFDFTYICCLGIMKHRGVKMDYDEIVDLLAPCGLDCSRCIFYGDGAIKRSSVELAGALEGFENVAPMIAKTMAPAMADYDKFLAILELAHHAHSRVDR